MGDNIQDLGKIVIQVQSYMERFREFQSMKADANTNILTISPKLIRLEHFTVLGLNDVIRVLIHKMKDKRPITAHCLVEARNSSHPQDFE